MKHRPVWLLFCVSHLFFPSLFAEHVGETAEYILSDSDRTSWLITGGNGKVTVSESRDDEELGPSYVVNIDYSFDVRLIGSHSGTLSLLVPQVMFSDQFYEDIKTTSPVELGPFDVDYEGIASTTQDSEENEYFDCVMLRLFNFKMFSSVNPENTKVMRVLSHHTKGAIENMELRLKTHATIPVLRAVQIDMSGTVKGFDVNAGMDFVPQP